MHRIDRSRRIRWLQAALRDVDAASAAAHPGVRVVRVHPAVRVVRIHPAHAGMRVGRRLRARRVHVAAAGLLGAPFLRRRQTFRFLVPAATGSSGEHERKRDPPSHCRVIAKSHPDGN